MRADTVAGIVFILLAILVYSANWQPSFEPTLGDPGSMLLPTVIGMAMGFGGLVLTVQSLVGARGNRAASSAPAGDEAGVPRRDSKILWTGLLAIIALVAYVVLLHYIGYLISTTLFFASAAFALGERSLKSAMLYSVIALAVALVTFYVLSLGLKISLPEGSLFNLIEQPHA